MRVGLPWNWIRKLHECLICFSNRKTKVKLTWDWLREPHDSRLSFQLEIDFIVPLIGLALETKQCFSSIWVGLQNVASWIPFFSVFPRFGLVCKMWIVGFPFSFFWSSYSLHWWLPNGGMNVCGSLLFLPLWRSVSRLAFPENECVWFFALPSAMAICFETCLPWSVEVSIERTFNISCAWAFYGIPHSGCWGPPKHGWCC